VRRLAALFGCLLAGACEDGSYRAIGSDVRLLSQDTSVAEEPALARLTAQGRRAIPQIEIALHTAPDRGRLRLFAALERIGDGEVVPILRHFAVYDASAEVRARCEQVLRDWGTRDDARGARARIALQRMREKRDRGEGPPPAGVGSL
jgi:hypothetical protein